MNKLFEEQYESDDKRPLVTMVLCAYNQEKYVREAVEGALAQTYSPLEIILSDDCSTDNTFSIMQSMTKQYRGSHCIVLNRNDKNLGICGHVNYVWKQAKGKWIVGAAGDDISRHDRVERVMREVLANPEIKLVESYLNIIDVNGAHLRTYNLHDFTDRNEKGDSYIWDINLKLNNLAPHMHGASMAYSREVLDNFPSLHNSIHEDTVLGFRAELLGKGVLIREPLVSYRVSETQVTAVYHSPDIAKNYRGKIRRHLDLVEAARQNIDDFNVLKSSNELAFDAKAVGIEAWLFARLNFFSCFYKALSKSWPIRLVYLVPVLFRSYDNVNLNKDAFYQIVLPKPIYFFLKARFGRRVKLTAIR